MHSKRINSGDSNKHRVNDNNHHKQNDHHNKTSNEKTASNSEKSMMAANTPTIPDTTHGPIKNSYSKRIHSGDSNKHRVTENNHQMQNDHHNKTSNEKTASIPDKSMMVEHIHTISDTTDDLMKRKNGHSTPEPTIPGKTNR